MRFQLQIFLYSFWEYFYNILRLLINDSQVDLARIHQVIVDLDLQVPIDVPLFHIILNDQILVLEPLLLQVDLLEDDPDFVNVIGENSATDDHSEGGEELLITALRDDIPIAHGHGGHGGPVKRVQVPNVRG